MGVGAERSRLYIIYWQLTMLISGDLGAVCPFLLGQNFVIRTRPVFFTPEPAFLTDLVKIPVVP